ncbi:MAG: metal transporter [Armatimonadetes bacterium]|nr:metal transporter [Armatimonadota bacterium]
MNASPSAAGRIRIVYAVLPLLLLGLLVFGIIRYGSDVLLLTEVPPVEELSIQWITLQPGEIKLDVINGGPDPVTVAQVMVDEAYWRFTMEPADGTLDRLERGEITIYYPWVEGETHAVRIISRNGVTFDAEIPVAVSSPTPNWGSFGFFAMLGVLIGVVPVGLGLMWYPLLGNLSTRWMRFFLSLTMGLLVFLGLDTIEEGLEVAEALPGALQGTTLLFVVALVVFLVLTALSRPGRVKGDSGSRLSPELLLALMIALGIGLHNLGEGLAVGSAYVLGKVAVGASLVVGFTLHNITEGLAIVAPAAKKRLTIWHLIGLGALAGVPTIAGTLIGGFTYSAFWALIFFAVAAGAIFQVVYAIAFSPSVRSSDGELALSENLLGFFCGLGIMYLTGLLVAV